LKGLAEKIAERIAADRDLSNPTERYRIGLIESWVSIIGNVLLTAAKATFGYLTNSIALIADAVHSASDIFSSLVVLIGFSLAKRKPDPQHPHGHGRIEYLAGLVIALMLIGAGALFIVGSYNRLIQGVSAIPTISAMVVVAISILVKELMSFFSFKMGKLINSPALIGDALHHRSDSLSSLLVLIALVGSYLGLPTLDAYFGFVVALFIVYAGIKIARQSCSSLLGEAPQAELQKKIIDCAIQTEGVLDAHDLEIHDYGSWKVVTVHIGVDGHLSLDQAHYIAHQVESRIGDCFHCQTVVHIDPR
jgi:cation diffusion facilitator family transporter